jgi:DNA-binding CsgD family transcriptional regulator
MSEASRPVEKLTPREVQVLKLIATGLSTREIAVSLGIAFKTAACHRTRVMGKLGVHEVANLTRYAIRNGYVDDGGTSGREQPVGVQVDLFDRIKTTEAAYRKAMRAYSEFLKDRESIGLATPDGSDGARRLRKAEEMAHREYHSALVALKEFLIHD